MLDVGLPRRRLLVAGAAIAAGFVTAGRGVAGGAVAPDAVVAKYAGKNPQQWGTDIAGIRTSFDAQGKQFALTFDACGGPGNDDINENLLSLLVAQRIPATLFLNKRWIEANQARAAQLAGNPLFELANHGTAHRPLSVNGRAAYDIKGTASPQEAVDEVWGNHERLTQLMGHPPRFFRSGTAHYDEIAVAIVQDLGETPVGYSLNVDYGATSNAAQVQANMMNAKPGGISLAHMHRPKSGTGPGMYAALTALKSSGFQFVRLP